VAHGISDQAADAIHAAYPRAEVLVHADPKIAASSKVQV
jgi:divalent metal cation (Fe/Co/Zn/Cd) transporter